MTLSKQEVRSRTCSHKSRIVGIIINPDTHLFSSVTPPLVSWITRTRPRQSVAMARHNLVTAADCEDQVFLHLHCTADSRM